jgi:hypothetical protein
MWNSAFNPTASEFPSHYADEYIPASEREVDPPAALYGPPPSFAHYKRRTLAVLGGPSPSLFVAALEDERLRKGWARRVAVFTGEAE